MYSFERSHSNREPVAHVRVIQLAFSEWLANQIDREDAVGWYVRYLATSTCGVKDMPVVALLCHSMAVAEWENENRRNKSWN